MNVDLRNRGVTDAYAQELLAALKENTTVTGIYHLARGNPELSVGLRHEIEEVAKDPSDRRTLLEKIAANEPTLTAIDLDRRGVTDAYAQELLVALKENSTVTRVDVLERGNPDLSAELRHALEFAAWDTAQRRTLLEQLARRAQPVALHAQLPAQRRDAPRLIGRRGELRRHAVHGHAGHSQRGVSLV